MPYECSGVNKLDSTPSFALGLQQAGCLTKQGQLHNWSHAHGLHCQTCLLHVQPEQLHALSRCVSPDPIYLQELFQLLMRQLFDPSYGMFLANETTRLYWFRPSSMDLHMEVISEPTFCIHGIYGIAI